MAGSETDRAVREILGENRRRHAEAEAPFDPVSGLGSLGKRVRVSIGDNPASVREQWLPEGMMCIPLVRALADAGSIRTFLLRIGADPADYGTDRRKVVRRMTELRNACDFPFWCASFVWIGNKEAGPDVRFILTPPQRRLVAELEDMRLNGEPIRLVLLKARQWGGSTAIQMYMAWLQLTQKEGLNSVIVAHQASGSAHINEMFERMLRDYPVELLHPIGEPYSPNEPKWVGVGNTGTIHRVPQRGCEINVGTAERPDSCRSGSYSLAHFSEVAIWPDTKGKTPEDIIQAVGGGILYRPLTMIVHESTAKGTGNFFHRECVDAEAGRSQFRFLFVRWFDIGLYSLDVPDPESFARRLWENRLVETAPSDREESGRYLWMLWEKGATLEAVNWYVHERTKFTSHARMASEYPSDSVEAFSNSGSNVFDRYRVEDLRPSCRAPKWTGEVQGDAANGREALKGLHFVPDANGRLLIWAMPEPDTPEEAVRNRYLVSVDVGGRWDGADWSVIAVFDRLFMTEGEGPEVVAQWYGHCDMDVLAWKAAQIAAFYGDALLVIESNTLESRDANNVGDHSEYILEKIARVYPNLYARDRSAEEIRDGRPTKWGFHTNVRTKEAVIDELIRIVRDRLYVEHDERALHEYLCYERRQNNSYGAVEGEHDDILMTRAIGLYVCYNLMKPPKIVRPEGERERRSSRRKGKVVGAATI